MMFGDWVVAITNHGRYITLSTCFFFKSMETNKTSLSFSNLSLLAKKQKCFMLLQQNVSRCTIIGFLSGCTLVSKTTCGSSPLDWHLSPLQLPIGPLLQTDTFHPCNFQLAHCLSLTPFILATSNWPIATVWHHSPLQLPIGPLLQSETFHPHASPLAHGHNMIPFTFKALHCPTVIV